MSLYGDYKKEDANLNVLNFLSANWKRLCDIADFPYTPQLVFLPCDQTMYQGPAHWGFTVQKSARHDFKVLVNGPEFVSTVSSSYNHIAALWAAPCAIFRILLVESSMIRQNQIIDPKTAVIGGVHKTLAGEFRKESSRCQDLDPKSLFDALVVYHAVHTFVRHREEETHEKEFPEEDDSVDNPLFNTDDLIKYVRVKRDDVHNGYFH